MKTKLIILGLATYGLVTFGQDNSPNPAAQDKPADAAPPPAAVQVDKAAPAAAPEAPKPDAPAPEAPKPATPAPDATTPGVTPGPGEVVPLIVIDEVPLTDAIRNLARQSNLNFQFDPKITASNQPNVSIRFENVTAQEALLAVLENHNLALVKEPKQKIARVTFKDPKAEDPLFTRIVQLKYSDPTNLIAIVKGTLSPRSSVVADRRTSQLIVTTTEKEMDALEQTIEKLDTPDRQVLIEAKLIETARAPSTIKGIDWTPTLEGQRIVMGNNALPGTPPTPATPAIITPTGIIPGTPASPGTIGGIVQNPALIASTAGRFFQPSTAFLNADGLAVVLSFLNKDSDSEVVATPRAVTLDNREAVLSVTRAFPIFEVTPGSANSPAGGEITYTNLGTILHVTPRITADNNVSLRVVPEVSNIDSVDRQFLNGSLFTANIYAIRKMETQVLIPSGNTLVMGGMVNDTQTKNWTKVPILGDIPGLGWAFRREGKSRNKSNLLIFLTPTIVEDEAFHLTSSGTDFLKTKASEKPDTQESAWDSGRPHDWTKPVY
jgi:type II secretory pathway component GspD/PulD (secretin)